MMVYTLQTQLLSCSQ